jgi:plasmid stabilization system protein ParE
MAGKRPVFTENFSANLRAIENFLGPDHDAAFRILLKRLFDDIIPTLCRFPQSGRSFLAHAIQSTRAKNITKKLRARLEKSDDLREFILDDYLLLYLVRGDRIVFLSIKHHRQLSFDLKRFWTYSQD